MRVSLAVPPNNDRSPLYLESALATLHHMLSRRNRVTLGYIHKDGQVKTEIETSDELGPAVIRQCRAAYPSLSVRIEESDPAATSAHRRIQRSIALKPRWAPLRTWDTFTDRTVKGVADPVAGVLSVLADTHSHTQIRITIRRVSEWRRRRWQGKRAKYDSENQAAQQKLNSQIFAVWVQLSVSAGGSVGRRKLRELEAAIGQFVNAESGKFRRVRLWARSSIFTAKELASLWHPPVASVKTDRLERASYRQLEPPQNLPEAQQQAEIALLGCVDFPDRTELCGMHTTDRQRHFLITGMTGTGKSTLLRQLFLSDAIAGRGAAILDPHGDLAESIAAAIPKHRTNDAIYFDASDRTNPIAFNPLACSTPSQRPLVASGIVGAFKKLNADSWGPRLEYILKNAVLTLTETPESTLFSLQRLLTDAPYRMQIVGKLTDPVIRTFWESEFGSWKPSFQAEAVAPILNKIGPLLSNPILRGIVGQSKSRLNLRTVFDKSQLLICNLSQGRIGEDAAKLLGSFFLSSLQIAALSRADLPAPKRTPFFITCDEFQTLSTEAFSILLSQGRKFGVSLTLATQYLAAIPLSVREAIFGNVASMLAFQISPDDAETLAFQFGGDVTPQDLMGLPKYHAIVRLLLDGSPTRAFTMTTFPPEEVVENRLEVVRKVTRRGYGRMVSTLK